MVAGGQITTMARGASPVTSMSASALSSSSDALRPFIFQFPAISGVIVVVIFAPAYLLHRGKVCPNPGCQNGLLVPSRCCGKGRCYPTGTSQMLDSLRAFAKSWPGKIMGGFLLVGVAGFGINNVITDLGSNTVARVGNVEINSREFMRAYQSQLNQVAQQIGSLPTAQDAINLGIPSTVLQNLAQDAAMDQLADGFGLGVSDAKLSEMLRQDPSFQSVLGAFDASRFTQVLQASGLTEAEYFEDQSGAARRQQLILSLFGDTKLPATASNLINRYTADKRTIDYFVLGEINIETPAAPTEEELAAYLTEHQAEFRTVETRSAQMLRLTMADLAATMTISDDAIAAEYERTKTNLTKAERRTIQQVVLNAEQVAAFEAGVAAGTPFETLVSEAGL